MSAYVDGIKFITIHCCNCGMPFGMSDDFYQRRKADGKWWSCPRGHQQHFTETTEARLKRELEGARLLASNAETRAATAKSQRDDARRAHKRMRTRIQNGVCPCCNRTFTNLMRHMQTQHAESPGARLRAARLHYGLSQQQLADEASHTYVISQTQISNYERGRPVSREVEVDLERWVEGNA